MALVVALKSHTMQGAQQCINCRVSIGGRDEQVTRVWRNRCTLDPTVAGGSISRPAHLDQVEIGGKDPPSVSNPTEC